MLLPERYLGGLGPRLGGTQASSPPSHTVLTPCDWVVPVPSGMGDAALGRWRRGPADGPAASALPRGRGGRSVSISPCRSLDEHLYGLRGGSASWLGLKTAAPRQKLDGGPRRVPQPHPVSKRRGTERPRELWGGAGEVSPGAGALSPARPLQRGRRPGKRRGVR